MSGNELRDSVAIVTGGGGGIGTCITRQYARAGARVVIAGRNQERLDEVAAEVRSLGNESLAIATDVCVPEQVDSMVRQTVDRFGRIDVLVNNAGGALFVKAVEELSPEEWNATIALNLTGTFLCSTAVGKVMVRQKSGKIINVSSVAGIKGAPTMAPYAAAKAGVMNLTMSLAAGWAQHNIRVNCIVPGLTATEGIRRWGILPPDKNKDGTPIAPLLFPHDPEHVANLAVFLASQASDHITGESIPIRAMVSFDR